MKSESSTVRVLFIGDVVGKPGRKAVCEQLDSLVDRLKLDMVAANAENAAGGFGITRETASELFEAGVHVLTTGNHVWDKKEGETLLGESRYLIRPANFPPGVPGSGWCLFTTAAGVKVGVINLSGRVFMDSLDCPFRCADALVAELRQQTPCIVVDFHAEATSEKRAMGIYLDGRVSALLGTHTHVTTADERVQTGGTAYISDVGMTGNEDSSVIGIDFPAARHRFLTGMPSRFDLSKGEPTLNGVVVTIDSGTGRALSIERVSRRLGRNVTP